jgi:transcriptional regulator with XRE-family HTH domain
MTTNKDKKPMSLREARLTKTNLTMIDVAEKLGVHFQTIRNWEVGTHKIPYHRLLQLCEVYDVKLGELDV